MEVTTLAFKNFQVDKSLVGGRYKLLTKVLANGLRKVVDKVVFKFQKAFAEGRQIFYAMLIANEAVDSTLKKRDCGLLCKLDIERTYNHVKELFVNNSWQDGVWAKMDELN